MSKQDRTEGHWPRILLVEDNPTDADAITTALSNHFATAAVTLARNGAEALRVNPSDFDTALLNIDLPDCTGLDVLQHLLDQCDMPVLMVTHHCDDRSVISVIRSGACDYIIKQGGYLAVLPVMVEKALVMNELKSQNQQLHEQLHERNQQLEDVNQRLANSNELLRQMADRDPLTGLSNRRHFDELLKQRCAEARRYDHDLACMMIDIDDFKQINDTLGHQAGDQVLMLTAAILRTHLRAADLPARYGGDEFVVLLPHSTALDACSLAKRIARRFDEQVAIMVPDSLKPSLSIGLQAVPGRLALSGQQLISAADQALLQAKQSGKGRVVMATRHSTAKTG